MKDLKPCPFCGGVALIFTVIPNQHYAECTYCGANFNQEYCWSETAKLAAGKWNARKRKTNVFKRLINAIRG